MPDKLTRKRAENRLAQFPQVRRIASGVSATDGFYYLAVISRRDNPKCIPEKIEGISIGIRYIEDD